MSEPWLDYEATVEALESDGMYALTSTEAASMMLAEDYESACEALQAALGAEIEGMKVRVRVFLEPQQ